MIALLVVRMVASLLALADGGPPGSEGRRRDNGEAEPTEARPEPATTHRPRLTRRSRAARLLAAGFPIAAVAFGLGALLVWVQGSEEPERLPEALRAEQVPLGLLLIALSLGAIWVLWRVPQWQAAAWAEQSGADPRERFEIENASRATLGQILSGVAVLAGLVFAWQQLGSATRSVQLSEQGQVTDRFTRAVEQLGSDNVSARLGGIYALERLARDSERDYGPAMEILAEFVREESIAGAGTPMAKSRLSREAAAVMRVIARRTPDQVALQADQGMPCIDLTGARLTQLALPPEANLSWLCLQEADLSGATLLRASFAGSNLSRANLSSSQLEGSTMLDAELIAVDFEGSDLSGAGFVRARLDRADLSGTLLVGTRFAESELSDANFADAQLTATVFDETVVAEADFAQAVFAGADLSGARNLVSSQLEPAFLDGGTVLPAGIEATPDF